MSGTLAIQDGKLIMQDGKLGFCCCPGGCQWRVLWTYDCGACSDGHYPSKGWTNGMAEKLTEPTAWVPAGDYVSPDGLQVMRYGRMPAAGNGSTPPCGDTPAYEDLDTSTQPDLTPSPSPCLVDWYGQTASFQDDAFPSTDCADCPSSGMAMVSGPFDNFISTGPEDAPPALPNDPDGWIDDTKECTPASPETGVDLGVCYAEKWIGSATPRCPT